MPIVSRCTAPGCEVLTIGSWCIEHDLEPRPSTLLRGRPFPPLSAPLMGGEPGPARLGRLELDGRPSAPVPQRLGDDRGALAYRLDGS